MSVAHTALASGFPTHRRTDRYPTRHAMLLIASISLMLWGGLSILMLRLI